MKRKRKKKYQQKITAEMLEGLRIQLAKCRALSTPIRGER